MNIVVTGANRGIGKALVDHFKARGETVIGTSRGTIDGLLHLDVNDPQSQAQFGQALSQKPVDLLVCNAGVYLDKGHRIGAGYSAEIWEQTFRTNVTGVFLTVETMLPNLRLSSAPRIAIISSVMASSQNAPGQSYVYRASKAAVLNLGRNLAVDLRPEGIAVGIYHPGWVQTDMGGSEATIDVDTSAAGLMDRFDALDLSNTGEFVAYDGAPIPF